MAGSLREIGSRVMMMVARGVLRGVKDDGGRQQLQVELLKGSCVTVLSTCRPMESPATR